MKTLLLTALLAVFLQQLPAAAAPPTCDLLEQDVGACYGDASTRPARGDRGESGSQPARPVIGPVIERRYAPACSGNTMENPDLICPGASTLCANTPEAADLAFWVWSRTYRPGLPEAAHAPFVRQPGFVCLGPQEAQAAQVPTVAQVAALVQRDFQRFVVVKGETVIDPPERTLVNVDTIFSTPTSAAVTLDPLTLLGRRVLITIRPETYTWHFGDGTSQTTTTPGRPRVKDVTHVYRRAAAVSPYVVISWSGTFTVDGSEPLTVQGRATTTGPGTPLRVLTAQSELVAR